MSEIRSLVASLADRDQPRTEAMVQADVRRLLIEAPTAASSRPNSPTIA